MLLKFGSFVNTGSFFFLKRNLNLSGPPPFLGCQFWLFLAVIHMQIKIHSVSVNAVKDVIAHFDRSRLQTENLNYYVKMSVCKIFKTFRAPCFSARCDTVIDSMWCRNQIFHEPQLSILVPEVSPAEFAILSLSGCWNIVTDNELRYHKTCGVDIYLGDIMDYFSTTNISEKNWLTTLLRSWPWFSIKASYTLKHSQLLSLLMP